MAVKIITAIGDSIVDGVGRSGVGDTDQWLYKLMQALGQTNIRLEPLPEFGVTPNILQGRWAEFPGLCNGTLDDYQTITDSTYTIDLAPYYTSGTLMFAARVFSQDNAFTLRVYTSIDNVTWSGVPHGTLSKQAGHSAGWSFCNWTPTLAKYVKLEIIGDMRASEVQIVANIGNDRGSCLNKIVGQDYIFNNVGLGSQQTEACLLRFRRDVIDLGSDTVMILAGINDIYQNTLPSLTQERLMAMYDLADEAGIKVIPITLLPYTPTSLTETRFLEIKSKIEALNSWIRSTASVRRYGLCDWYQAMEDPSNPGHMYPQYTGDGIHLSVLGNAKIVEAFDLNQLSVVTHDFYGVPAFMVPFTAVRTGENINFTFGNNIDTHYRIYSSPTAGVTANSTLITDYTGGTGTHSIIDLAGAYYRCYGVNTGVWSAEVYVDDIPAPPREPEVTPTQVITGIASHGIKVISEIEELDRDLV